MSGPRPIAVRIAALTLLTALPAQVPEGWGVASVFKQGPTQGLGGVTVFHPYAQNLGWEVTGLPDDLTGASTTSTKAFGANAILIHPKDGRLIVGERTTITGDNLEIHEFVLAGRQAVSLRRHLIGKRVGGIPASIKQMAWLPDGRILFAHTGHDNAALAGSELAILDLANGALTKIPVVGTPDLATHLVNAMTVDRAGTTAYIGYATRASASPTRVLKIYSVPIPSGGPATLLSTYQDVIMQLAVDNNGDVLVGTNGAPGLLRWDSTRWSRVGSLPSGINGLAIDRVTGALLCMAIANGRIVIYRIDPNGTQAAVFTLPPQSSQVTGIAIRSSMATYGTGTPGAYRWAITPNPGGAPRIGAGSFSLTANATSGAGPGFLGIGLAPTTVPLPGFLLLIDQLALVLPLASTPSAQVNLPVPNDASLAGLDLYAQMIHTIGTATASSTGLRFSLF